MEHRVTVDVIDDGKCLCGCPAGVNEHYEECEHDDCPNILGYTKWYTIVGLK